LEVEYELLTASTTYRRSIEKFQTGRLDVALTQAKCNSRDFRLLACCKCLKVRRTGRPECLVQQSPLKHNHIPLISYI